jgi:hypothetical protein
MFDDLHDPNPPTAGMDALASVATRARQLRRRRSLALGGAGVAVVALAVAAFVLPGRDRASVAPADSVSASLPFGEGPVPQCGALTDPVWMPNGELPGTPETISGIDPFTGDRVDGRVWSSPEGYGLLVQLPASADVLELPTSGQMWDLRVRDARPAVDSVEVTIWRRAGNCAARYLVPGDVETATAWGTAFVDQLTVTAAGITLVEDPENVYCPAVGDVTRGEDCLGFEPQGDAEGAASQGFVIPADGFDPPLLGPVGVVFLLIPVDAEVSPRSRLASEQVLGDGRWKAFLDIVPADVQPCFEIVDGETSIEIGATLAGDGGGCSVEPSGSGSPTPEPTTTDSTATTTTALVTTVAPTIADPVPAGERSVVAIDGNGDAVVFDDDLVPTVVFAGTDPDDPPAAEGPTTYIDGVAASADGSTVAVGVCCEPSAGALWRPDPGGGDGTFLNYGHLPALTSFGNLVWYTFGSVNIGGVDGSIATTLLELDPSEWTVTDLAVVQRGSQPEEVLVLASRADGTYLWRAFVGGGDMQLSQQISTAVGVDAELSLAGFGDDQFLVLNRRTGAVEAYDAQTLQPIPTEADPVDWISAWITPDGTRHVDADGVLWVNGTSRGGDYRWVR